MQGWVSTGVGETFSSGFAGIAPLLAGQGAARAEGGETNYLI